MDAIRSFFDRDREDGPFHDEMPGYFFVKKRGFMPMLPKIGAAAKLESSVFPSFFKSVYAK